jgi:hypothetical protein
MVEFDINAALPVLEPLAVLIIGIALYGIIIFSFYKFLAKRDIFKLDLEKHNGSKHPLLKKAVDVLLYLFEYILLFPIITFVSFAVMAIILLLLSKTSSVEYILLVSMAVVGSVRVASYYNELLAEELAKILPLTLLVLLLADVSSFSVSHTIDAVMSMPSYYLLLAYYLVFAIILEFVMKMLRMVVRMVLRKNNPKAKA